MLNTTEKVLKKLIRRRLAEAISAAGDFFTKQFGFLNREILSCQIMVAIHQSGTHSAEINRRCPSKRLIPITPNKALNLTIKSRANMFAELFEAFLGYLVQHGSGRSQYCCVRLVNFQVSHLPMDPYVSMLHSPLWGKC